MFYQLQKSWSLDQTTICRLRKYLQIKEVFNFQIEEISADRRTTYRSKHYLQIKDISEEKNTRSPDQITTNSLKKYVQIEVSHLQIEEVFCLFWSVDWNLNCRSKFDLHSNLMYSFFKKRNKRKSNLPNTFE